MKTLKENANYKRLNQKTNENELNRVTRRNTRQNKRKWKDREVEGCEVRHCCSRCADVQPSLFILLHTLVLRNK